MIGNERIPFESYFRTTEIFKRESAIREKDILAFSETMNGYFNIVTNDAWQLWNKAKAVDEWISVNEQLPNLETDVLVIFKGNIIQAGLYRDDEGLAWWSELLDGWDLDFEKVSHWKPQINLPTQSGAVE